MTKVYNNKVIAKNKAVVNKESYTSFRYRGFSSREYKKNYKLYDYELIKQDIINHFHIRKGEKLENPSFGTIIWDVLFEQFTQEVKQAIANNVEEIINYDTRVKVQEVIIDTTEQGMRIEAALLYLPQNYTDVLIMNFDKKNGLTF